MRNYYVAAACHHYRSTLSTPNLSLFSLFNLNEAKPPCSAVALANCHHRGVGLHLLMRHLLYLGEDDDESLGDGGWLVGLLGQKNFGMEEECFKVYDLE
nr:hypothetical protein CFP56_70884 [Quercus suber]